MSRRRHDGRAAPWVIGITSSLLAATVAFADPGDEIISERIGNTTISSSANGDIIYYYKANHTFTGFAPDGSAIEGSWKIRTNNICLTWKKAPNTYLPTCLAVSKRKVGETWRAGAYTMTIVPGIKTKKS